MACIGSLPPELLIQIFVCCSSNDLATPTTLSLVCRQWREITCTSPHIWRFISLVDRPGQSISSLKQQTTRGIAQSSPIPFDIDVTLTQNTDATTRNIIFAIYSAALPTLHRWRTFSLCPKDGPTTRASISGAMRSINPGWVLGVEDERIGLDYVNVEVNHMDDPARQSVDTPWFMLGQSGKAALNVSIHVLPSPGLMSPISVATLIISDNGEPLPACGVLELLDFFTAFPQLETLVFYGKPVETRIDERTLPVVSFPRLQRLILRSTCAVRMILSNIDAPMLTFLHLEHINVDLELVNFPVTVEEGDSEDEAHDFSQSPWSDRALGMGLRRLQRRCHPPLHTLIMEYADMRTKDFIFCFKTFPLREFQIVASDMSDKVIRMLEPFEGSDGSLRVRLPELVKLRLCHCQRLSGDAVVETLCARARFVDKSKELPSFEYVSIEGCSDVSFSHNLALSLALGSRFNTSEQ